MITGASVQGGYRRALAPYPLVVAGLALIAALVWPGAAQAATVAVGQNQDAEIVYIDPDGVIRVVDPRPSSSALQVRWASPDGGWTRVALGDVNGDRDAEIIAVRPEGDAGRLTIFDPVLAEVPPDHERFVDGVAWDTLYSMELLGHPRLVITGEFDPGRPGVEILVSHFLPEEERSDPDHQSRVLVLRPESGSTSGREWEVMTRYDAEPDWTWGASGDADNDDKDEVALIDERTGNLSVFRVGESLALFFRNVTSGNPWRQAAFGQFTGGGGEELVAVRGASLPLASFWVFRYENNTMVDDRWEAFLPSPHVVFLGDLGGNDDVEAIMLRNVRPELGARPRLIIRDNGNDPLRFREALLDGDNGYQSGAAGDIDADGWDEIAIMRDSRIRIYTQPETDSTFEEIVTPTNAQVIQMGNVDTNGLTIAVSARPEAVAFTYYPCVDDPGPRSATVTLQGPEGVAFTAELEDNPAWGAVTPVGGRLPGSVRVTVNPNFRDADVLRTELVLTFALDDAPGAELRVPVVVMCARSRLLLPFVQRVTP